MPKHVLDLIKERVIIFDGGMGTELIARGLENGQAPERWILEEPDVVQSIHKAYYDAGADVVQTDTFGGTRAKLSDHNLDNRLDEINKSAVQLLRDICPEDKFIAGNIGPTGKFLEPMGDFTIEQYGQVFFEQAKALIAPDVDLINIETMYSLDEAVSALRAVKRVASLPVFVCLTYNKTPKGFFTLMGETVQQCCDSLAENGADVIGTNCTLGSEEMIDLVKEIRECTSLPIIAEANAGQPVMTDAGIKYDATPEKFAEDCMKMIDIGVNAIGGCCGTTPEFIKKLKDTVYS